MAWTTNAGMEWSFDGGSTWTRVSDHGRSPINVNFERIETRTRMADGRLRRYVVTKKRTFSASWENLPDKTVPFLANGQPGNWMENIYNTVNGSFHLRLRAGSDADTTITGLNGTVIEVMLTDFTKTVTKRGKAFDMWDLDVTLEEV